MFSVHIEKEEDDEESFVFVVLHYKSETVNLRLSPENSEIVPSVVLNSGTINSQPSNGDFSLTWDPLTFTFEAARHGDGQGGSLIVTVPNNPRTMASFREALGEWYRAVNH